MVDPFSIALSSLALGISATTFWFTLLRRGRIAMTRPTIVCFAFDSEPLIPKIFLRTLLYSTSLKGKVIESMYARLSSRRSEQVFSFWGYAEGKDVVPGSGLYVGQTGFAANHHFVLPMSRDDYEFLADDYTIEVFARLVGKTKAISLMKIELALTQEHAAALKQRKGVMFELALDENRYVGRVGERPM